MPGSQSSRAVLQLRVAVTTADFERLLRFYAEGLGLEPAAFWQNDGGRAAMLELGQASLEIFDESQARAIDQIEVG
ncbi:MAG TPA: VOC family protein, partial [Anaerolineales bacterium]|nr:VOC family protein [Anaerolineales bacterium]